MFFLLHTLNGFFLFYGVAQHFQQVDDLHILVDRIFQGVLHPAVGLAADVDEQIAVCDLHHIVHGGLVAVQVNAIVQQHRDIGIRKFVAENLPYPVVFREDGGNDA